MNTMRKRDGLIPPKKEWQTEIIKTITIGRKKLKMVIHESNKDIDIYIGGHDIFCIHATLIKRDNISIGFLNKVRYDSVCSLENDFVRGIDTSLIIKLLLTYIARNYKNIKSISFNDTSSRECDNGELISLANMTFVIHGKTWYEKNYGAFLKDKALETFNSYNKDFQKRKIETDWDTLTSFIPDLLHTSVPEEELKTIYEVSKTWQEFFKTILEKIEISNFCEFVQPWIEKFMKYFFKGTLMNLLYNMPIVDYNIEYTETQYQRGGHKYTRRRARKIYYDDR